MNNDNNNKTNNNIEYKNNTIFPKENQMLRLNKKSYFVKLSAVKVKYVHTGIKYMYL